MAALENFALQSCVLVCFAMLTLENEHCLHFNTTIGEARAQRIMYCNWSFMRGPDNGESIMEILGQCCRVISLSSSHTLIEQTVVSSSYSHYITHAHIIFSKTVQYLSCLGVIKMCLYIRDQICEKVSFSHTNWIHFFKYETS